MEFLIGSVNTVFGLVFAPLSGMRPEYALALITAVTGVAMLFLYKWTSNQPALKLAQDRVKAHILEIRLYQTDIGVMLRALVRVFVRNLTYLRLLLLPAAFLMLIVVVIVIQCWPRFQYRPLNPGEPFIFKASLKDGGAAALSLPAGVTAETAPLYVPSLGEYAWRLRVDAPGEYTVKVSSGSEVAERIILVGDGLRGVSPVRAGFTFANYLENPLELPLAGSSAFKEIVIKYPERTLDSPLMLGMGWLVYFFVVSFIVALAAKVIFKIN